MWPRVKSRSDTGVPPLLVTLRITLSDFGANAIVRFDLATEEFTSLPLPDDPGNVRQVLGRPGGVWGAESAADKLILIHTRYIRLR